MNPKGLETLVEKVERSIAVENGAVRVIDPRRLRETVHHLAIESAIGPPDRRGLARYLTRSAAIALGALPSSIHELYLARGRGDVPATFTVPAMNLRALSFHAARAVFRAALRQDAAAIIFEIARSEIGYTEQRPAEYATSVLAAAIAEGYAGPVFIQGDHFQISASRYGADAETETEAVRSLTAEAIEAGFFNIDIDTSTLVDLSRATVPEQQEINANLSASLAAFIRSREPRGVTVSVGGEIGEVGGKNSTEQELRAYVGRFRSALEQMAPGAPGLSKISIQTGTSHGGVVLPDGSIAEVNVDFDTLQRLSRVAREDYGMAGAVQHGASTLPEDAFGKFADCEACEVHLATNFQNMMYDRLPEDLRKEIYSYLDKNHSEERKPGMTEDQFYYKTRKRAIGPFKAALLGLDVAILDQICDAWEAQFSRLFELLRVRDTKKYVDQFVQPLAVQPSMQSYLEAGPKEEDVSDLAD